MLKIAEALNSVDWSTQELPPLSESAQRLLSLTEEDKEDPRLLALFAQKDPILLGKLLSLANSALNLSPGGKPTTTAEGAIRQLGVTSAYATMLGTALADTFADKLDLAEIRRFLVQHSFTRWNTARGLCRFLGLDASQSFVLQLAAILEPLGIFAALLHGGALSQQIRECIETAIRERRAASCKSCEFEDYTMVSAKIAAAWGTPQRVVDAINSSDNEDGVLVRAVDALIGAKLKEESQAEALKNVLSVAPRWQSFSLNMEIDLVQFG
jgi:HD-like signal output (HDOD) protein